MSNRKTISNQQKTIEQLKAKLMQAKANLRNSRDELKLTRNRIHMLEILGNDLVKKNKRLEEPCYSCEFPRFCKQAYTLISSSQCTRYWRVKVWMKKMFWWRHTK